MNTANRLPSLSNHERGLTRRSPLDEAGVSRREGEEGFIRRSYYANTLVRRQGLSFTTVASPVTRP